MRRKKPGQKRSGQDSGEGGDRHGVVVHRGTSESGEHELPGLDDGVWPVEVDAVPIEPGRSVRTNERFPLLPGRQQRRRSGVLDRARDVVRKMQLLLIDLGHACVLFVYAVFGFVLAYAAYKVLRPAIEFLNEHL